MGQSPSWPLLLEAGSTLVRALRQPVESMDSFLSVRCAPLDASEMRYPAVRRETTVDGFETAGRRHRTGTAAPLRANGTTRPVLRSRKGAPDDATSFSKRDEIGHRAPDDGERARGSAAHVPGHPRAGPGGGTSWA